MEINKLVEENIYLKTQLIDIKSKINQYDNLFERTDLKYQEQINNYQKQILKYNNYIHEIYVFFNNITNNYFPELNFSIQKNDSILISFEAFQNKLNLIEKFICDLNKSLNNYKNNNRNITEYSTTNPNNYFLTEFNKENISLEERITNLEKKIINKGYFNKTNKKNFNFGKNKSINNNLRSKYHYGNNNSFNMVNNSIKQFRKIKNKNLIKNNERYRSALGKSQNSSNKISYSEFNSKNNNFNKNIDLKGLKKSIPNRHKRSMTPLSKQKKLI